MRGRHRWHWATRGGGWVEAGVFVGWDCVLGVSGKRHPTEWNLRLHVPFAMLDIVRVRDNPGVRSDHD